MKKAVPYALVLTILLLTAFLCGLYVGRSINHYPIQVSVLPSAAKDTAAETVSGKTAEESVEKINVNTASAAILQTLPGIGEVLAHRIIDYREENGPFTDLAGLLKVEGIGEKKLEAILDYATVGG